MTDARWQQVKTLFQATLERPHPERAAFLTAAAGADEAVRREVESLLEADRSDRGLTDRLPFRDASSVPDSPAGARAGGPAPPLSTEVSSDEAALRPEGEAALAENEQEPALAPGTCLGRYEIRATLGAGAVAFRRAARDRWIRSVAIPELMQREFVEGGGYTRAEYWDGLPFEVGGRRVGWREATEDLVRHRLRERPDGGVSLSAQACEASVPARRVLPGAFIVRRSAAE